MGEAVPGVPCAVGPPRGPRASGWRASAAEVRMTVIKLQDGSLRGAQRDGSSEPGQSLCHNALPEFRNLLTFWDHFSGKYEVWTFFGPSTQQVREKPKARRRSFGVGRRRL